MSGHCLSRRAWARTPSNAQDAPLTGPDVIRAMMETILHILSKDTGEKSARKAKGATNELEPDTWGLPLTSPRPDAPTFSHA